MPSPIPFARNLCPECTRAPPPFLAAACAVRYGTSARALIGRYKRGGDRGLERTLVALLEGAAAEFLRSSDAVTPVPAHRRRAAKRGFDGVGSLTRAFAHQVRLPFRGRWLVRVRDGPPQASALTPSRSANVRGAFACIPRSEWTAPAVPRGARLLLVDDVITSGSTARECAAALRRAGAREVRVVAVARGGVPHDAFLAE